MDASQNLLRGKKNRQKKRIYAFKFYVYKLKILSARLQQYVKHEIPDVQDGFRKGRETRDQTVNLHWIMEKAREFCFIDSTKAFDYVDHNKRGEIKEMGIPEHLTCLLRNLQQVKKLQLEPDMEQLTGSKLGKENNKTGYCHPAYLTYMQSTSC